MIVQLAGRSGNPDPASVHCSRTFNRVAAYEAHLQGFPVLEREEIERRLLFKSEYLEEVSYIKPVLHLDNPAPNIVGTALLSMVACLERNGSDFNFRYRQPDL